MCTAPKIPKPEPIKLPPPPAQAPPPPEDAPIAPALNEDARRTVSEAETVKSKRKGTRGLRIDLQIGGTNSGTGLNIPRV
ncbi:MAG: hypothetical protein EOM21_21665 [Gammaproteobacteria bacterium]|nr:hypothetical protein [Gammaproteobacteria bacterium]